MRLADTERSLVHVWFHCVRSGVHNMAEIALCVSGGSKKVQGSLSCDSVFWTWIWQSKMPSMKMLVCSYMAVTLRIQQCGPQVLTLAAGRVYVKELVPPGDHFSFCSEFDCFFFSSRNTHFGNFKILTSIFLAGCSPESRAMPLSLSRWTTTGINS